MVADTVGEADLRAENVSRVIQQIAMKAYKLKPLCNIQSSSAWKESFYQEGKTTLTGYSTASPVKGIPRLANFPYGEAEWKLVESWQSKYGMEGVISYEDERTNNVPVIARTLKRVAEAVTNSVDIEIESGIRNGTGINTFAITGGYEWDSATVNNRDPVKDILNAIQYLRADNYDALAGNGYLVINGTDYTNIISNQKVLHNPTFKSDITSNGGVGQLCGLKIVVTESVTAEYAYVLIAKEFGTWQAAKPLTVVTIDDPGVKKKIRAWEIGVLQVTNPEAICAITNTRI